MWLKAVVGLSAYQVALIGLFQADIVSGDVLQILEQYPPLVVVLVVVYYLQKAQREDIRERRKQQVEDAGETREWLESMLANQRSSLKEVYEGQQKFVTVLLSQIESRQNNMSDRVELLTQQLAINTSTVSEIAKVDSIVGELIARLESK
jgi:hypothetical protein